MKNQRSHQTRKLIAILAELISLLNSDDETHWSAWMAEAKRRLEGEDVSGVQHLLSAYGGMGSFNDLILCQDTSHGGFRWKEGYEEKNDKLAQLRSSAWELAMAIKQSVSKARPITGANAG